MKNKKIILIISCIIILLIICGLIFLLLRNRPYVIAKGIKVSSPNDEYSITVEPYFKDENKNVIDIDGMTWKKSTSKYRFYDYTVSEPDEDNFVTYKFKIESKTPIEYIEENNRDYPYHRYTFFFRQPSIFDYYTGTIFNEKIVSIDNTTNYYNVKTTEEDMAFTEVTWKNKTYKVGVRAESLFKWDGINKTDNGDGTKTVRDTATLSVEIIIYAPKEYDGLMVFSSKKGTSKQDLFDQLEYNKKYNELVKEAEETGKKSNELIEMEENNSKHFKLLEARSKGEKDLKNDSFFVIRVSEIEKEK